MLDLDATPRRLVVKSRRGVGVALPLERRQKPADARRLLVLLFGFGGQ